MARFCGKCGARLNERTGRCPNCDRKPKKGMGWVIAVFILLLLCAAVYAVIQVRRLSAEQVQATEPSETGAEHNVSLEIPAIPYEGNDIIGDTFGYDKAWETLEFEDDQCYTMTYSFRENGTFYFEGGWWLSENYLFRRGEYRTQGNKVQLAFDLNGETKVDTYILDPQRMLMVRINGEGLDHVGSAFVLKESLSVDAAGMKTRWKMYSDQSDKGVDWYIAPPISEFENTLETSQNLPTNQNIVDEVLGYSKAWSYMDHFDGFHYVITFGFEEDGTYYFTHGMDQSSAGGTGTYEVHGNEIQFFYQEDGVEKSYTCLLDTENLLLIQTSEKGLLSENCKDSVYVLQECPWDTVDSLRERSGQLHWTAEDAKVLDMSGYHTMWTETKEANSSSNDERFAFLPRQFDVCGSSHATGSVFNLNPNGTFTCDWIFWDWGDWTDEYPDGTCQISKFRGKFSQLTQVDELTYKMTLDYSEQWDQIGREYVENNKRYIVYDWDRFEGIEEVYIYLPGTKYDFNPAGVVSLDGKELFDLPANAVDWEERFAHGCVLHIDGMPAFICEDYDPARTFELSSGENILASTLDFSQKWSYLSQYRVYKSDSESYLQDYRACFTFSEDGSLYLLVYEPYSDVYFGYDGSYSVAGDDIEFTIYYDGESWTYLYRFDPKKLTLAQLSEEGLVTSIDPKGTVHQLEVDPSNN